MGFTVEEKQTTRKDIEKLHKKLSNVTREYVYIRPYLRLVFNPNTCKPPRYYVQTVSGKWRRISGYEVELILFEIEGRLTVPEFMKK